MTHQELQEALDHMAIPVGAAEAHGWLCGALCARSAYGAGDWLRDMSADAGTAEERKPSEPIRAVHDETLAALRSSEFEFAPLLPGDEAPLGDRVAALAAWSHGFLYGLGSSAPGGDIAKAGDVGEYLGDLSDIARAELEPGRSAEAGEEDYTELFEFVRAGTQLTWDELAATRSHAAR
jgi:uncharacterized protein